jgi:dimethylhistidine N-methyltransferase
VPAIEPEATTDLEFARDVRSGLTSSPKWLPPRWFYDSLGSALFEAITQLPWYPISRAESALLSRHAAELVELSPDPLQVVELGVGDGAKLARIVAAFAEAGRVVDVHLVDVSSRALEAAGRALADFGAVRVTADEATFEDGLDRSAGRDGAARLVLFLGSNLGNFDPARADALIARIAGSLAPGDLFLLGTDLIKPAPVLIRAYDDPLGVTAAFNKNVLQRINAQLGADFDLAAFAHEARWNAGHSRVEMHLVSSRAQRVRVPAAGVTVRFEPGESIWTESSYKYDVRALAALGAAHGFVARAQWVDPHAAFALTLFAKI